MMNKLIKIFCVLILITTCKNEPGEENDIDPKNQINVQNNSQGIKCDNGRCYTISQNAYDNYNKNFLSSDEKALLEEIEKNCPIKLFMAVYSLNTWECNACKLTKEKFLPAFDKNYKQFVRTLYINTETKNLNNLGKLSFNHIGPYELHCSWPKFYFYY